MKLVVPSLIVAVLLNIPAVSQAGSAGSILKTARNVWIDNQTGDKWVPANVRLAPAASGLDEVKRKEDADLVLRYARDAKPGNRTVAGNEIRIAIDNIYTLEVIDWTGKTLWENSTALEIPTKTTDKPAADRERSLRNLPAAKLTSKFLSDRGK
jgi:hypothetical protein